MSAADVDIEQAQRIREAETQWLRQSADRIRAAHLRARDAKNDRTKDER
jgi:hypothetical protein